MTLSLATSKSTVVTFPAQAGRIERCLVDEVFDIGAGKSRGAAGNHFPVDVLGNDGLAHVHLEDLLPSLHVGKGHDDLPVETARTQKRRVENVGAVRGRNEDDPLVGFEAVHLDQKRVEGLLALVVSASQPCTAVASDGVDLIDEDDAGGVLLSLGEKVPHAGGPDADEHLDEVRSADGKKRHIGFTGDGAGKKRFPRTRGPHEKNALGDTGAETSELFRIPQNVDDLLQLGLGLVDPATSLKVTFLDRSVISRARLLPNDMAFPPPICICRMKKIQMAMSRMVGNQEMSTVMYHGESSAGLAAIFTPFSLSSGTTPASLGT